MLSGQATDGFSFHISWIVVLDCTKRCSVEVDIQSLQLLYFVLNLFFKTIIQW